MSDQRQGREEGGAGARQFLEGVGGTSAAWGLEFEGRGGFMDTLLMLGGGGILPNIPQEPFQRKMLTVHLRASIKPGEAHLESRKNSLAYPAKW